MRMRRIINNTPPDCFTSSHNRDKARKRVKETLRIRCGRGWFYELDLITGVQSTHSSKEW
jgi:hypothetical protein